LSVIPATAGFARRLGGGWRVAIVARLVAIPWGAARPPPEAEPPTGWPVGGVLQHSCLVPNSGALVKRFVPVGFVSYTL
jgi:hypothetical protein